MAATPKNSHLVIGHFNDMGFTAGMILKAEWQSQDDVYNFIRQKLLPPKKELVVPTQVHGAEILVLDENDMTPTREVDGTFSRSPAHCLTVTTADCIPMLMADPVSGFFAAVHIGWRGLVGGIAENSFRQAKELGMVPAEMKIYLGASIGVCCFEVGHEVAVLFEDQHVQVRNGRSFVDLRNAVRNKIMALGVAQSNIGGADACTYCNPDRYYSCRRDKNAPVQMVSFIFKST